jgi:4-alpha-glucanotransferase
MSQLPPSLVELAGRFGIATEYQDWSGRRVDVEESTVVAVLAALGVAASDDSGIVHDLAVGLHPDGADSWALQDALALGVAAGAPPDEFNQLGQDWSQPPWRPDRLDELEYRPFPAEAADPARRPGGRGRRS